jgi:hypothetical protein
MLRVSKRLSARLLSLIRFLLTLNFERFQGKTRTKVTMKFPTIEGDHYWSLFAHKAFKSLNLTFRSKLHGSSFPN